MHPLFEALLAVKQLHPKMENKIQFPNIYFHGIDMKEGSILATVIYRIQYKVMNTCASRVLLKPQKGEMTLFIIEITKANVSFPRIIKWDKVRWK